MKEIPPGLTGHYEIVPGPAHTAAAAGNVGVEVVGTPFLIGYLEVAAHRAITAYCDEGEATVGARIEVDHLAPALPGRPVTAEATLVAVAGRRMSFEVAVRQGGRVIMKGRHDRAIVRLDKLLARAAG